MKKSPGIWNLLEEKVQTVSPNTKAKNWDKITDDLMKDEESEKKKEGVIDLFRDIYEKGDENLRKAMEKSFTESDGTVLSTNWADVGKKKVEPRNP